MQITTAARRLCREHNSEHVTSGHIHEVDLDRGHIGAFVSGWAATQPPRDWREQNRRAFLRISHGRMTQAEAQHFIDTLGDEA